MTHHVQLNISVVAASYMWFRPLTHETLDDHGNLLNAKRAVANASLNYDFERRPNDVWLLHIDVGLRVRPIAEIKVRTTFQTEFGGSIEPVLKMEAMHQVASIAIGKCLSGFNERCETIACGCSQAPTICMVESSARLGLIHCTIRLYLHLIRGDAVGQAHWGP